MSGLDTLTHTHTHTHTHRTTTVTLAAHARRGLMKGCTRKAINITLFPTCNYKFQPDAVPIVNGTTLYCIVGPRNQCGNLSRKLHTSSTTYVLEGMLEIAIISGCC